MLIDTERQEPLRTVVDPIIDKYIDAANQAVAEQFAKGLTIFGI